MSNSKIVIGIVIIIIVGIVILISNQEMISENIRVDHETGEIQITNTVDGKLNISGYVQIDKSQYNIGEKIFLDMRELKKQKFK